VIVEFLRDELSCPVITLINQKKSNLNTQVALVYIAGLTGLKAIFPYGVIQESTDSFCIAEQPSDFTTRKFSSATPTLM
jgi:hypothetical protein